MKNQQIIIRGRLALSGVVSVSGAKNAALPELAATILSDSTVMFENVPLVNDVRIMVSALKSLGAQGEFSGNRLQLDIRRLESGEVPEVIVRTTRASILLLGPLLARNGFAQVSLPQGCPIGDRKINFHISGLEKMGAETQLENGHIVAKVPGGRLRGITYRFPQKSVTGTENLLMAASLAEGTTRLENCALEPEVFDLYRLLKKMGANIELVGTDSFVISGRKILNGARHRVIPDRIEMGTFAVLGGFAGNHITINNAQPEYIRSLLDILSAIGVNVQFAESRLTLSSRGKLIPADVVTTPHPGFPTDLQAQLTTLLTQADGVSYVTEKIFNNRFQHTLELNKMGADITVAEETATIRGKTDLHGARLKATDLRASAALVLGGLIAEGETQITNAFQLFRGYENLTDKLKNLGASIKIIEG